MLDVRGLTVDIRRADGGTTRVLDGVSLTLDRGKTLGVVGGSGSGKSMLALAIMGLLSAAATPSGRILFDGRDLLAMPERELCAVRGARIGMVFQEPATALNPAMTVGRQVAEGLCLSRGWSGRDARVEALRTLDRVRIPDARQRFDAYPHQLSGGQRQRVSIAMALVLRPDLLIADEPTTALDSIVRGEILDLLDELTAETRMSLMLISHDLGVIARTADRTLVLAGGRRIEEAATADLLRQPGAQYTRALIAALPRRVRAALTGRS